VKGPDSTSGAPAAGAGGADRLDRGRGREGAAVRRLDVRGVLPAAIEWGEVVTHLEEGGMVAYPTETVYGFGGLPRQDAVDALLRLKARPPSRPLLLLVEGPEEVADLTWNAPARRLAEAFWPGPVTLILDDPGARFPPGVRGPDGRVAVRHSPHPVATGLVAALGRPLTSTSANAPGSPPAMDADAAEAAIRAVGGEALIQVIDAGGLPPSRPSTIVDCTGDAPRIVRLGRIPADRIRRLIPDLEG